MEKNNTDNPFVHEAAANLKEETILGLYIDFIGSEALSGQKNVFIEGIRGSGKSMILRYYSFQMQKKGDKDIKEIKNFAVYVPCKTPLFEKREYDLIDGGFKSSVIAEHLLVLIMTESLISSIIKTEIFSGLRDEEIKLFYEELGYYFTIDMEDKNPVAEKIFSSFLNKIKKQIFTIQTQLNDEPTKFYKEAYSYSSLILPLIECLKKLDLFKETHFSFFIDDGQMLSQSQKEHLNSWISFRDTSSISFKVAITSKKDYQTKTNTGTVILENHDYIVITLARDFFSAESEYYDFAKKVIEKRLKEIGLDGKTAENYFPEAEDFTKELNKIRNEFIKGGYPEWKDKTPEERRNNAAKFDRAIYFRLRLEEPKANRPHLAYTGFNTLVNISTGIIRNLLIPCYHMYENEKNQNRDEIFDYISYSTQYGVIEKQSEDKWESLKNLSGTVEGCNEEISKRIRKFLENFGTLLKNRLIDSSISERKDLSFTIEGMEDSEYSREISEVLDIAEKAGLVYTRTGPGRKGNRTTWYTPDRIFWPEIGIDPVGQSGRINIIPKRFYKMMTSNFKFEDFNKETLEREGQERGLFD